jgi:hypothetical protein
MIEAGGWFQAELGFNQPLTRLALKRGREARMIILGSMSFLLGALLGRRFKVFMLCPASVAVATGVAIEASFQTAGFTAAFLMIGASVSLLQIGYILALL